MRVAAVAAVAPTASAVATQAPMVFKCCLMGGDYSFGLGSLIQ
jgi:hypothetical protein